MSNIIIVTRKILSESTLNFSKIFIINDIFDFSKKIKALSISNIAHKRSELKFLNY